MKISYTRVIYNCEADIPLRWIDRACEGDAESALKALNENAGDDIEVEDIELGEFDEDDRLYMEELDSQEREDEAMLENEYLRGLGV